jgi:hypothetical protein
MLSNCDVEQHQRADIRIIRATYQMHDAISGLGDPTELIMRHTDEEGTHTRQPYSAWGCTLWFRARFTFFLSTKPDI